MKRDIESKRNIKNKTWETLETTTSLGTYTVACSLQALPTQGISSISHPSIISLNIQIPRRKIGIGLKRAAFSSTGCW